MTWAGSLGTYPECPQGVVGGVGLFPAAPVHQALQLDQEKLLGSGQERGGWGLRAAAPPGLPVQGAHVGVSS